MGRAPSAWAAVPLDGGGASGEVGEGEGAAIELRALKRRVFASIAARAAGLEVAGAPVRARRSADALRFEVRLADGATGLVHLATVKAGLPPGAFAIDPTALVYGGLVRGMLEQLPVPGRHIAGLGAILCASTPGLLQATGPIAVHDGDDAVIDRVVALVRDGFLPLLAAFSGAWPGALRHTLANPNEVDRPYATATVLTHLAGDGAALTLLESRAAIDPRFWDREAALAAPGWRAAVERIAGLARSASEMRIT